MKTIYLIKGTSGQYEDTTHWTVKAYINKKKAERYMDKLQEVANKIYNERQEYWQLDYFEISYTPFVAKTKSIDPTYSSDFDPAYYYIEVIKLVE